MIKNTLPINQEILNASTNNHRSWKSLQLMCLWLARVCWGRSTSCFVYGFVFQVIGEKTLCGKDFTRKLRDIFT